MCSWVMASRSLKQGSSRTYLGGQCEAGGRVVAECVVCGLVWGLLGASLDVPALVACALGKAGLSWPPGSWMWGLSVVSRPDSL